MRSMPAAVMRDIAAAEDKGFLERLRAIVVISLNVELLMWWRNLLR